MTSPVIPLLIVGLGTLVVPLDSAVNIDFPAIVAHFALPIPMIQWIVISYVLTQTALLPSFGRAGDIIGHRCIFLTGTAVSTLAFTACALSPNYPILVAARVIQGIGAGLILSCGPALATSLFPESQRTRILARYLMMFSIGGALGPSVFGLLVAHWGWSAVFSVRAPIAAVAFLLGWTLPRDVPRQRHERFDAAGGALLAISLSFLLLALNQLRQPSLILPITAALAAAGFALFYRQEHRTAHPIIDFRYFQDRGFTAINIGNALINLSAFAVMLLAPFYLGRLPGLSLPQAGLILAVSPTGMILAAPIAAKLAAGIPSRRVALIGLIGNSAGLLAIAGAGLNLWFLCFGMAIQGFGAGLFQVAYFDLVTAAIKLQDRGVAGALGMATRSIGTVTAATLLMVIFQTLNTSGAFLPAFQATFRIAAAIPMVLLLMLPFPRRGHT